MALQPRLGLLSQRRTRLDSCDYSNLGAIARHLSTITGQIGNHHHERWVSSCTIVLIFNDKGGTRSAVIRFIGMKKYIYILASLALLTACEQKETTVTNPPAEKKESNTTVVNPPEQKKESNTTIVNPPGETKKEKTEVNINTSPNP